MFTAARRGPLPPAEPDFFLGGVCARSRMWIGHMLGGSLVWQMLPGHSLGSGRIHSSMNGVHGRGPLPRWSVGVDSCLGADAGSPASSARALVVLRSAVGELRAHLPLRAYRTTHATEPALDSVLWRYGTRRAHLALEVSKCFSLPSAYTRCEPHAPRRALPRGT